MPTYEYVCKSCEQHLDVVQSFKDEPLTTCPSCGGSLRKVFGSIGIAFKGSGFYRTDNRSKPASGSKPAAKEAAASDSGSSTSDGSKAEGSKTDTSKADSGSSAKADSGSAKSA